MTEEENPSLYASLFASGMSSETLLEALYSPGGLSYDSAYLLHDRILMFVEINFPSEK